MPLSLRFRPRAREARLRGELNCKAARVRKKLSRAMARGPDELEVDLRKVTFLSSECGTVFLTAATDARRSGLRFVVSAGSPGGLGVLALWAWSTSSTRHFPLTSNLRPTESPAVHEQIPSPAPQESIQQVLACFDAYDRVRGARMGLLSAGRFSPRDEQRAFDDLRRAVERLRNTA